MARLPTDLEVGHIGRAHGLRGDVIVRLITDRAERVAPGATLRTDDQTLVVTGSRAHQKGYIVTFDGVHTREAAEDLRGSTLYAEPIDDPDVLWVHDLIGAAVEDLAGVAKGTVVAVQENPASDLLVLDSGVLVPLTFFVDQREGTVVIDPPAGLFTLVDEASPDDGS